MSRTYAALLALVAVFLTLSCEYVQRNSLRVHRYAVSLHIFPHWGQLTLLFSHPVFPESHPAAVSGLTDGRTNGEKRWISLSALCAELTLLPSPQVRWRRSSWRRTMPWTSSGGAADALSNPRTSSMVSLQGEFGRNTLRPNHFYPLLSISNCRITSKLKYKLKCFFLSELFCS